MQQRANAPRAMARSKKPYADIERRRCGSHLRETIKFPLPPRLRSSE